MKRPYSQDYSKRMRENIYASYPQLHKREKKQLFIFMENKYSFI